MAMKKLSEFKNTISYRYRFYKKKIDFVMHVS